MLNQWIDQLFERGKEKGFEAQEVYYSTAESLNLSVYEGKVEKFNLSEQGGLSYRGIVSGKMGYAFTEAFDEAAIDMLIHEAYDNAFAIESTDPVLLHDGSGQYVQYDDESAESEDTPLEEKIKFMVDLEANTLSVDSRIISISNNGYVETKYSNYIKNTQGLDVKESHKIIYAYGMVVAKENDDTRTGIGLDMAKNFSDLSTDKISKMATSEALSMLGAKPIDSMKCPVVFENKAFASFLSQFTNHFSAEQVQRKLSALAGKLNTTIGSKWVNITDNPHMKLGLASSSFDAEGVPTCVKKIVENGLLKTYLHNLKTAKVDGVVSTGNAHKGSYKSAVEVAPSNWCFEAGDMDVSALIAPLGKGVYITGLQGLHAGINSISGDFSLQCHGFAIEGGQLSKPISQITVSGNFFEMLMAIDGAANDFTLTPLTAGTGAPSIRVESLMISG